MTTATVANANAAAVAATVNIHLAGAPAALAAVLSGDEVVVEHYRALDAVAAEALPGWPEAFAALLEELAELRGFGR